MYRKAVLDVVHEIPFKRGHIEVHVLGYGGGVMWVGLCVWSQVGGIILGSCGTMLVAMWGPCGGHVRGCGGRVGAM